jgi:hypothetical protein
MCPGGFDSPRGARRVGSVSLVPRAAIWIARANCGHAKSTNSVHAQLVNPDANATP